MSLEKSLPTVVLFAAEDADKRAIAKYLWRCFIDSSPRMVGQEHSLIHISSCIGESITYARASRMAPPTPLLKINHLEGAEHLAVAETQICV
jgi:hypothetical protein